MYTWMPMRPSCRVRGGDRLDRSPVTGARAPTAAPPASRCRNPRRSSRSTRRRCVASRNHERGAGVVQGRARRAAMVSLRTGAVVSRSFRDARGRGMPSSRPPGWRDCASQQASATRPANPKIMRTLVVLLRSTHGRMRFRRRHGEGANVTTRSAWPGVPRRCGAGARGREASPEHSQLHRR